MDFTIPTMFPFCSHKVPNDAPDFFLNLFPIAHNSILVNYKARQKEILYNLVFWKGSHSEYFFGLRTNQRGLQVK